MIQLVPEQDASLAGASVDQCDGPGIPVAERVRLRERFARGSRTAASGSGLGLALVEQQAALHGGSLELATSRRGGLLARLVVRRDSTAGETAQD
jgi:signal transduction histidine kinase